MGSGEDERLQVELSLLTSMYPKQVQWDERARQLDYHAERSSFAIRLPEEYLSTGLPYVITANAGKLDMSESLRHIIKECPIDEEILDSIILSFNDAIEAAELGEPEGQIGKAASTASSNEARNNKVATVVVWLHHLLNTNKRKQTLSPASNAVSGITKPGYPGVLVYSGEAVAVYEHVNELKQLNWQAFQIRLESDEEWSFEHGKGVIEVEAMKEVVADIGEKRKDLFMESMRMK
ncbi:hypothetical protein K431DRAFT_222308 [Polychaeton citri CBS 116435]|uniref:RWD domain-containing protein n=1 Tax=Polychaeton citri CBS 116435 TaxID=1314669 RepID=A0A9P4UPZ0_9PEZI|nr:hypothetical protein K431DRAFT_222308 [Polychaeton citri CBS 116435]